MLVGGAFFFGRRDMCQKNALRHFRALSYKHFRALPSEYTPGNMEVQSRPDGTNDESFILGLSILGLSMLKDPKRPEEFSREPKRSSG